MLTVILIAIGYLLFWEFVDCASKRGMCNAVEVWVIKGFVLFLMLLFSPLFALLLGPMCGGIMPDYSTGQRSGYVTKVSQKGMFWQTHEAELQVGVGEMAGIQKPFDFSIVEADVLEELEKVAGTNQRVTVSYTQWLVQPLWRGRSDYEVFRVDLARDKN